MWLHGPSGPELIHTDHVLFSVYYIVLSQWLQGYSVKKKGKK